LNEKFTSTSSHATCVQTLSKKKLSYHLGCVKMTKLGAKKKAFVRHALSFSHQPQIISFNHENLQIHIDYRDVHAKLFIDFLIIRNMFFLDGVNIRTWKPN
jgi:hypothetical protein